METISRKAHKSFLLEHLIPYLFIYVLLAVVWYIFPQYSQLVIYIAFYMALGQAFNIFLGFTNYVCFGYTVFLALGMYGVALVIKWLSSSSGSPALGMASVLLEGFGLSVLLTSIVAIGVGAIALRLREAYFAIATIGLNQGIRFFIEGTGIWGGGGGLVISKDVVQLFGYGALSTISSYYADLLILTTAILSLIATWAVMHSRLGYGLIALRENEDTASVSGVNVTKYKLIAFVLSAVLAGMLGASKLLKDQAVFPAEGFSISYTVEAIVIVLLGGKGTMVGPIIGGLVYGSLKYYLTAMFPGLQLLMLAPVLIAIVLLFPTGIVGWLKKRYRGRLIDRMLI